MSERSKKIMKVPDTDMNHDAGDHDNIDADIDSAIFQLEMVHIELDKINEKVNDEILSVEQKYKKLKQQCYDKRSEIIENIPDFWFNVFTSHPDVCNILHEDEEDCLHYLQKLEVEMADNIKSGYSIKLYFAENPYFKNDILVKEFVYKQGNLSSVSSKIDWKKSLPVAMAKEVSSKGGRKRSHAQQQQSFFGWFQDNNDAASDIIAEIIRDDVWPNSLQFYLVPDPDIDGNDDKEEDTSDSSDTDEGNFDSNLDKMLNSRPSGEGSSSK